MLNALLETFSCVYSETMLTIISFFQKLIRGGGGWKKSGGGLENLSKINKRGGGRLFGTREYTRLYTNFPKMHTRPYTNCKNC